MRLSRNTILWICQLSVFIQGDTTEQFDARDWNETTVPQLESIAIENIWMRVNKKNKTL